MRSLLHGGTLLFLFALLHGAIQAEDLKKEKPEPKTEEKGETKKEPEKKPEPKDPLAGHSFHGEVFNEGPRQKAVLMGGTGDIQFHVTSKDPLAQKYVEQGIGQLHGFWFLEAERSFRQAAMIDPNCAIAYWGMALANSSNTKRAKPFIAEAVKRKKYASPREVMYIDAVEKYLNSKANRKQRSKDYVNALEAIAKKFPDDIEAQAFLGYAMYKYRSSIGKSYEQVDAVLNKVLKSKPLHPVHHFRIHLWDYKNPKNVLNSAARCGQGSPNIAHMWHMPGHIYSRLKRYEDAVWQMEASARVDHSQMMRYRVMPDQIHNFAHNNEWLIRNMINIGRIEDAIALAKNMIELPRHPKYNKLTSRGSAYYGRSRLFDVLKTYELWAELVKLADTPYLEPTDSESEQIKRLHYLGIALAETGAFDKVQTVLNDLEKRLAEAKKKEEANKSKNKSKPKGRRSRRGGSVSSKLTKAIAAIQGHLAIQKTDYKKAIELLRKGGEDSLIIARVQVQAGEVDAAIKAVESRVKSKVNEVHPLATQIDILWQAGKKLEAAKAFNQLRELSNSIQLGSPVFKRLAPIAKELKLPNDWRIHQPMKKDVGNRPALSTLGPLRWQPMPAEQWTLRDAQDKEHSLSDYKGRPVVVIFYLGYGCLHCAEQIQAFAPKTEKFRDMGIDVIAISTDDMPGLKRSQENYKEGTIPFPLVSDASMDVFKRYRVFDDFEKQPLHGTFLIDSQGRVRWQDISYEPFMDVDFLLEESKRLLDQSVVQSVRNTN